MGKVPVFAHHVPYTRGSLPSWLPDLARGGYFSYYGGTLGSYPNASRVWLLCPDFQGEVVSRALLSLNRDGSALFFCFRFQRNSNLKNPVL